MSRRRARLRNDLTTLEIAVAALGEQPDPEVERCRLRALASLRHFLLPRLAEETPPLMVALIGSTGSGKSTLFNSIAGRPISSVSVLRPTTREAVVWTSPAHAQLVDWMGRVVADAHPLSASVALIDTPDLDSDFPQHREAALEIADAADAIVMVTTAARYGDSAPWEALSEIPRRRLAVVMNRVPTRSSGSRNDLASLMRKMSYGSAPLLTISEQSVERIGDKLRPQAVQRLTALLRDWAASASEVRAQPFERIADRTASDVGRLEEMARRQMSDFAKLRGIWQRWHGQAAGDFHQAIGRRERRRPWWRGGRLRMSVADVSHARQRLMAAMEQAAGSSYDEAVTVGMVLPVSLRSVPGAIIARISTTVVTDRDAVNALFDDASTAWINGFTRWPPALVDELSRGVQVLADVELPVD